MKSKETDVILQIEEIKSQMCDFYCKFPGMYDKETEELELMESKICENCPLNRL